MAPGDPEAREAGRDPAREELDIRVRVGPPGRVVDEARLVRVSGRVLEDVVGEGEVGRDVDVGERRPEYVLVFG